MFVLDRTDCRLISAGNLPTGDEAEQAGETVGHYAGKATIAVAVVVGAVAAVASML